MSENVRTNSIPVPNAVKTLCPRTGTVATNIRHHPSFILREQGGLRLTGVAHGNEGILARASLR